MLVVAALVGNRQANGAPADVFSSSTAAPAITSGPPKAKELRDGDASVSTQTGNLNYSYPIASPPGRGKAQPSVGLSYSSSAPLYGGVAAGWSLSGIPGVFLDTSKGRIRTEHPMTQVAGVDAKNDDRFMSTLVGGRRLVLVTEPGGLKADAALRVASSYLGRGYRELAPGVYRSADGLRQFRMTTADLTGAHGAIGPHVHFEALNQAGRVIENLHVPLVN